MESKEVKSQRNHNLKKPTKRTSSGSREPSHGWLEMSIKSSKHAVLSISWEEGEGGGGWADQGDRSLQEL